MRFKAYSGEIEHDIAIEAIEGGYEVVIDGERREVDTVSLDGSFYSLLIGGRSYEVSVVEEDRDTYVVRHGGDKRSIRLVDPLAAAAGAHLAHTGPAEINAAMPGRVVSVLVEEGQEVAEGQGLIVLEAMKMENEVEAPRAGVVGKLFVTADQTLETGEKIAIIE